MVDGEQAFRGLEGRLFIAPRVAGQTNCCPGQAKTPQAAAKSRPSLFLRRELAVLLFARGASLIAAAYDLCPGLQSIPERTIQVAEAEAQKAQFIELTADIASAYVSNNAVAAGELPSLIKGIFGALTGTGDPANEPTEPQNPAVPIRKSITPDYLICLDDGRRFKSLKRHLRTKYGLSPDDYRAKWGLPKDYPMVAPTYSAARSSLAKQLGLGQGGRRDVGAEKSARPKTASKARRAKV